MNAREQTSRRRAGVSGMIVLAVFAGLVGYAGAQAGPSSDCIGASTTAFGSAFFGTEANGNRLFSVGGPTSRDFALSSPLEAGTYDIDAVSYDGYPSRETTPAQPFEHWFIEFLSADGAVLATTGATGDIADGVTEDTWSGTIGQVTLESAATTARVVHAAIGDPNSNSVRPVCMGAQPVNTAPPMSSLSVDYENVDGVATPVGINCGNGQVDGATGVSVELIVDNLEPDTVCEVSYSDGSTDCNVVVTDNVASSSVVSEEALIVTVPESGGVDIGVSISCAAAVVRPPVTEPPSTVPVPPTVVPTPTTVAPAIKPEVKAVTEVATPIDMNPAFTG